MVFWVVEPFSKYFQEILEFELTGLEDFSTSAQKFYQLYITSLSLKSADGVWESAISALLIRE